MRMHTTLLVLGLLYSIAALAQPGGISGSLTDSVNKKQLVNSSVALLRKADSVLVKFTRTGPEGKFAIPSVQPGNYVFLVTHPSFADYSDTLRFTGMPLDLGTIFLTPRSKLMEEIIVKKTIPAIRIKGDTVVYKADSFHVQPGATVEDLLKKLPGVVVDKNGKITAQGETVKKVLVDGEEFFSDDPTIATRNLQSNMVEDVEVFNKKSDQAEFTGIDDGSKTKTINLKLKEDKKNGYFGKAQLGSDFNNYWNNQFMGNYFKGKKKISGFGIMASDGRTGLDWQENMNYGGSGGFESGMSDDGGMYINFGGEDELDSDRYRGEGLPRSWSAGLHFSNKWNLDHQNINGNYRYNKLDNDANISTRSQYILPDTLYYVNENNNIHSERMRHRLEGIYDFKLDSSQSLKLSVNGYTGKTANQQYLTTESLNADGDTVNTGRRINTSTGDNEGLNSTLTYRKKFKRDGHTFSATVKEQYSNTETEGFLKADNQFYNEKGLLVREDLIDQKKISQNKSLDLSARLSYTQPISKRSYLEFNYQLGNNQGKSARQTLEKSNATDPKYDTEVPQFTNDFDFNTLTNRAGMNYRYSKPKKFSYSFGAAVSQSRLVQHDLKRDSTLTYRFTNFFPQANLSINMKHNLGLYVNYYGATQNPTIQMLQPVADNTNPLNVYIGNPNLKLAVNHNLNVYFQQYDMLSESGFFGSLYGNVSQRGFSTREFVDTLGRRIYQTVNANGIFNGSLYFSYNFKIKNTNWSFDAGTENSYMQNINYVNSEKNRTRSGSVGLNAGARYNKEKKYSFSIRPGFSYSFSESSIRKDIRTNYWMQNHSVEYGIFMGKKFELNGEMTIQLRQRTEAFPQNTNAVLWNMWLDRKIGKNDPFRIRLYAFDILNQNIGFRRTINTNLISERTYNTFNRYLMVSLIWNFSKNGKPMSF